MALNKLDGLRARMLSHIQQLSVIGLRLEPSLNPAISSDIFCLKLLKRPKGDLETQEYFNEKAIYLKISFFKPSVDRAAGIAIDLSMPFLFDYQTEGDNVIGFGESKDFIKALLGAKITDLSVDEYPSPLISIWFESQGSLSIYRNGSSDLNLEYDLNGDGFFDF
jgi:hypothetical protein